MKKYIQVSFSAAVALLSIFITSGSLVQAQTTAPVCPAGYTCSVLPACPAGYTCVAATQPPGCPTGYYCTGTSGSTGNDVTTTDATVTMNGTPSLALTYDSSHKESALTATFNFTVHGNTQGIALYKSNGLDVSFITAGHTSGGTSMIITPTSVVGTSVDAFGRTTYLVSPGQTVSFTMTVMANPSLMFAGSYTAALQGLFGNPIPANSDGMDVMMNVAANQSNAVTIVGELSPYITTVTTPIGAGQTLTIQGQRLNGAVIFVDNAPLSNVPVIGPIDGSSLSFAVPANLPDNTLSDGYHQLFVKNDVTGQSNVVSFQEISSVVGGTCYVFSNNLNIGSSGPDVVELQGWLLANGFNIPAIASGQQAKGQYGFQTAAAVIKYQNSVGITPATGYFGPTTRASVNASCSTTNQPSITVISPNGGETFPSSASIAFNGTTNYTPKNLVAYLYSPVNGNVASMNLPSLSGAFNGTLGSGNPGIAAGQYKIEVCDQSTDSPVTPGKPLCDLSDNYFNVVAGNSSFVPTISGVSGPTVLSIGQTGKWTVSASDPSNGSLSYSVDWGDNNGCPAGTVCPVPVPAFIQTAGFTHSYSAAGTYTVTFTVKNASGATAQSSITVQVGNTTTGNGQANLSLDASSPLAVTVPVTDTVNGRYQGLPILIFDVGAQNSTAIMYGLNVQVSNSGTGNVSAAYLYQGSNLIESASVSGGQANFGKFAGPTIAANTTDAFIIKVDVNGVTSGSDTVSASLPATGILMTSAFSASGTSVPVVGSVNGNPTTVAAVGAFFSLAGAPTIAQSLPGLLTATFNVNVQAIGSDVQLGLSGSRHAAFGTGPLSITFYKNGVPDSSSNYSVSVASYSQPNNTTISSDGTYFTLVRNNAVTIRVSYSFTPPYPSAGNVYALQLSGIAWNLPNGANQVTSFTGTAWRTTSIGSSANTPPPTTVQVSGGTPTISSVSPSSGTAGSAAAMTITGTGFAPGDVVYFSTANGSVGMIPNSISAGQIILYPVPLLPTGTYTVQIGNGTVRSTSGTFTVLATPSTANPSQSPSPSPTSSSYPTASPSYSTSPSPSPSNSSSPSSSVVSMNASAPSGYFANALMSVGNFIDSVLGTK